MTALLVYSTKSALVLTLLYLPYTMMLRRESFFRMNRITLLAILVLAMVLPMADIPLLAVPEQPVVSEVQHHMMLIVQEAEMASASQTTTAPNFFSPLLLISIIYTIGVILASCLRFWQLFRINQIIRGGCLWTDKTGEATVYCHIGEVAPFSWMCNIVINEDDYQQYGHEILLHEKAHILCRHSFDILLLTFVEAIQWWNPIVYILGGSMRDVHEYEADDYVLRQGISLHNYQALLVKKALANTSYAFANNFNHSLTKKRIYMMNHPKSNPWMQSKVLYIFPMTLAVLTAFATPKLNEEVERVVEKVKTIPSNVSQPSPSTAEETVTDKNQFPKVVKMKDVVFVYEGKKVTMKAFKTLLEKRHEIYVANHKGLRTCLDKLGIKDAGPIQDKAFDIFRKKYGLDVLGRMIWIQTFEDDEQPRQVEFGDFIVEDNILTLQNAKVVKHPEQKYIATDRFELDGYVTPGLRDVSYLIYFYIDNDSRRLPAKPVAEIPVKDGRFSFSMKLDKEHYARVQAIFDDGSICSAWMNMYFKPGHKLHLTVKDGEFDQVSYPIFDKQTIE